MKPLSTIDRTVFAPFRGLARPQVPVYSPRARMKPSLMSDPALSPTTALLVTATPGGVRFAVHARPKAKKSAVVGVREGALDVRLAAPPVDGQANQELVRLLASVLGTTKAAVRLVRGSGSREKLIEVAGLAADDILLRLKGAVAAK